eukprot:212405-Rhodomonas_salina.3
MLRTPSQYKELPDSRLWFQFPPRIIGQVACSAASPLCWVCKRAVFTYRVNSPELILRHAVYVHFMILLQPT